MVINGEREGGINWEIRTDIYTLPYLKEITNKDILYSTGNSIQYSVCVCVSAGMLSRFNHV